MTDKYLQVFYTKITVPTVVFHHPGPDLHLLLTVGKLTVARGVVTGTLLSDVFTDDVVAVVGDLVGYWTNNLVLWHQHTNLVNFPHVTGS